jgi:SET domain-containing protein
MRPGLIIRSSSIHAAGCYTTRPICKGTRVCEYDGPRMTKEVADERYTDRFVTYLFGYGDDNMVIDGFGTAMFINHCCNPNCETEDDNDHIYVIALRDIAAGEELTYEYNLYDSDDEEGICYCGAPQCRGTMFSDLELERRAKIAKKAVEKAARKQARPQAR